VLQTACGLDGDPHDVLDNRNGNCRRALAVARAFREVFAQSQEFPKGFFLAIEEID
jgi:hypothetical protein